MPADRRENNRGLLAEFGLSGRAEHAWLVLLENPSASAQVIAESIELDVGEVDAALADLACAGLVRQAESASGYRAHEPSIAIESLIARSERELALRRERLEQIRAAVPDLTGIYAEARAADAPDLDVVSAHDEVQQRIFLAGESTRVEHRHLMRNVRADTVRKATDADAASITRGVQQRSIIGTTDLADPEVYEALAVLHELGEDIRALPYVPCQAMIMDRSLAVIPREPDDRSKGAIFIRERALVEVLIYLFDHMWSVATPVFSDAKGPGAPTGRTARVLELMAAGVKDETIGRTLGIGARTVRREIAAIKESLGATSRTEIVAAAVRQGWL